MEDLVDDSLGVSFQFGVHFGSLLACLINFVRNSLSDRKFRIALIIRAD